MMKRNISVWALLLAIAGSFSFNSPSTIKDVSCSEDGKFWFVYNGTTRVYEDSDNATQAAAAKLATNYTRLQDLDECNGDSFLSAICAFPQVGSPNRPHITGQAIATEIDNYVSSSASHSVSSIIECSE